MHASCMSRSCDTRLMHMWDMTHWYVGHDSMMCQWKSRQWYVRGAYLCDVPTARAYDSMICATCLVHRVQSSWVVMVYISHCTNTSHTAQTHLTLHKHIWHCTNTSDTAQTHLTLHKHKPYTTHLYVGRDSLTGTGSTLLIRPRG